MEFNKNYKNHDLILYLKYNKSCTFYKCNKCNKIINFFLDMFEKKFIYEEVYKVLTVWQANWDTDLELTCEELMIKELLE